ncbi:MAG: hypothetical protein ACM65K_04160 [Microcoleus sp.]
MYAPRIIDSRFEGKKLVLVGDHRQLPPMFDRNTIADIAEEIGCSGDELSFIKESYSKRCLKMPTTASNKC